MKRLVYILHDIKTGGVEVALLSAIPKLNKEFELSIIVLGDIDATLLVGLTDDEKRVFHKYDYKLFTYPIVLPYIIMSVLKLRPDIIISSLWRGSLIGISAKMLNSKIKYFAFIHSNLFFHKFDHFFSRLAINTCDSVLTDSKSTYDHVKTINPDVDAHVISFLTNVTPNSSGRFLANDHNEIRLLSLGRLNTIKNIPSAIEAIAYLRKNGLNVVLDIYGRDDGAQYFVEAAIKDNNMESVVTLKGEISPNERFGLFEQYHGLIQCSLFEGMAMSVVEAMQYGMVCFVTPVGEIPNYSADLLSAVYINVDDNSSKLNSFDKMKRVLSDVELCKKISYNAWKNFEGKPVYADSLVGQLLEN